jgi:hypothetical protein
MIEKHTRLFSMLSFNKTTQQIYRGSQCSRRLCQPLWQQDLRTLVSALLWPCLERTRWRELGQLLDLTAFGSQRAIPKVALVAIRHVVDREREHAYVLASVAVDLKVNQVVDAPNWTVSAYVAESLFPPDRASMTA